jgi:hypothetical protein
LVISPFAAARVPGEKFLNKADQVMISKDPLFRITAELGEIQVFGKTPYGERRVIEILSGRVEGPMLTGKIMPGGSDWQIIRSDGVADIRARYAIETESGARILVRSDGLRHGPPDVMARIARGENVDSSLYYFRTIMRYETSEPSLGHLNKMLALAYGERTRMTVKLDVHEIL